MGRARLGMTLQPLLRNEPYQEWKCVGTPIEEDSAAASVLEVPRVVHSMLAAVERIWHSLNSGKQVLFRCLVARTFLPKLRP